MDAFDSLGIDDYAGVHNELVAAVLRVMVEASSALDTQSLCSLLQLNTRCRKAVLCSRGHHSIRIKASADTVAGFLAWLPRHAGLVAGLQLVALRNGRTINWRYHQTAQPPMDTAFASALQQSAAAAHAVPPFSTSAAHPAGTAEAATMPLLLTSFSSQVAVTPAVLQGLPCATLTRLELDKYCQYNRDSRHNPRTLKDVPAMLQQLTSLNTVKLTTNHHHFDTIFGCPSGDECIRRLPYLPPWLTRLDFGPLESLNTAILPTSLVELKLTVEFKEPREPPSDDEEFYGSPSEDESEWEEMADEDWVQQEVDQQQVIQEVGQEVEEEAAQQLLQAAWRLDLTHLPLLQRCKVRRVLSHSEKEAEEQYDYTKTMTVALAAPHLTRLELCNLSDVFGLPVPCDVQVLWLIGCTVRASRIAQLISHMPDLVEFRYHGSDATHDEPCCNVEGALLELPIEEERMVATALGGATKLTSLIIDSFGPHFHPGGYMVWGDNGLVEIPQLVCRAEQESPPSSAAHPPDQDPSRVHWGYHVSGLVNLRCLVLCSDVQTSDVLQLTALTALTELIWDRGDTDEVEAAYEALVPHLPALKVLNPWLLDLSISW